MVWLVDVEPGGEVLGLAPGLGLFSCSFTPGEPLGPLAVATSRLDPGPPVPLTTGVAAEAIFALAAEVLSTGLVFPFFALDA